MIAGSNPPPGSADSGVPASDRLDDRAEQDSDRLDDRAEQTVELDALQSKKILVGVTGGIAAYKVVEVVRTLTQLGAEVHVIMTRSAQKFVGEQTFASISGRPVATEVFGGPEAPHVELARGADLAIVAPATATLSPARHSVWPTISCRPLC